MVREAKLERTEHGLVPQDDGWFVLNLAQARWLSNDKFGALARFEGQAKFPQFGINVRVLQPGQSNCYYHREDQQEDFLVLAGSCRLLVEGRERMLKRWDLFHCPPNTDHVIVGAGDGPCAVLMVGHRAPDQKIVYPVEPLALEHGAGVRKETTSPAEAYADTGERQPVPTPAPFA